MWNNPKSSHISWNSTIELNRNKTSCCENELDQLDKTNQSVQNPIAGNYTSLFYIHAVAVPSPVKHRIAVPTSICTQA